MKLLLALFSGSAVVRDRDSDLHEFTSIMCYEDLPIVSLEDISSQAVRIYDRKVGDSHICPL
jgi:hypothetical protein